MSKLGNRLSKITQTIKDEHSKKHHEIMQVMCVIVIAFIKNFLILGNLQLPSMWGPPPTENLFLTL